MKKIITARDILKKKGYLDRKFDSNGFLADIGGYYMEHGLNYPLTIFCGSVDNDKGYKTDFRWNEEKNKPEEIVKRLEDWTLSESGNDPFVSCYVMVEPQFFDAAVKLLKTIGGYKLKKDRYRFKIDTGNYYVLDFYYIKLL